MKRYKTKKTFQDNEIRLIAPLSVHSWAGFLFMLDGFERQERPKSGPRAAKSGPRAAKSGPRAAKSGPKAHAHAFLCHLHAHARAPRKMHISGQDGALRALLSCQERSKSGEERPKRIQERTRAAKSDPRAAKSGPRAAKSGSRAAKRTPRAAKSAPRATQEQLAKIINFSAGLSRFWKCGGCFAPTDPVQSLVYPSGA